MNYKVIITGPVGSGKTTAVNSLTNKNAMLTDAVVSDADLITKQRKKTTTVAMDYDVVRLNDDIVHVYGTPGQERFDFMWEILSQGANGIILLLDNTRNYPFRDLKYYTNRFAKLIKVSRLIIGITRFDIKNDPPVDAYKHWLKTLNLEAEVIAVDAREKNDITPLFCRLLDIKNATEEKWEERVVAAQEPIESEPIEVEHSTNENIVEAKGTSSKSKSQPVVNDVETADKINHEEIEEVSAQEISDVDDTIQFDESMLDSIKQLDGITGVTLSNSMGELLQSTIKDEEVNELIAFLSGITPEIETTLNRGKIHRIMLRSPHDDNLTIFVEQEKSLGVSSNRRKSVQVLSQQVEDMLQWM